jgi:multidrug efflux pump subunit AcrA (membrane-fusion protein)
MRKRLLFNGVLVLVLVAIGAGVFMTVHSSSSSAATTQTLATAKKGVVLQSVTSTGNVEAPTDLSLSFQQSGQVTQIAVKPGQRVTANQVLARVDDTQQKIALQSAQASLASAQANLAALQRGETAVERQADDQAAISAQAGVTTAQQSLADAQANAMANVAKYDQAISAAEQSLTAADAASTTAQGDLSHARSALTTIQAGSDPSRSSSEPTITTVTRYSVDQVACSNHTADASFHPSDGVTCSQVANLLTFAKNVQTAESSATQAESQQSSAQFALTTAQQGKVSGEMQDQQSIQTAQGQLTNAQNQYNSTIVANAVKQQAPKPEDLAQAQASIVSAQVQLTTAQKNESDTILRAPVAGVVAAVNGIVGQQSSGSSASSAGSSSSASSSSSTSTTSSSSGFIQLTNVNVLDVKVGMTETDAPKVKVGQVATITLDALPNASFTGHVISLDTDSTVVSNVVTYYAKVAFDDASASVKPGMTASVSVVLDKVDSAITLPTSAVSTTGTTERVTVKAKDGTESTRSITIGLRGDSAVEITDGLSVGDQVVLTSSASTTGAGGATPRGAGGGGLGGGGLGGGAPRGGG